MPCFDALSDFSTQDPSYNGFVQKKEEHTLEHGYLTQIETSRYVGTYGTDVPKIVRSILGDSPSKTFRCQEKVLPSENNFSEGSERFI